MMAVTNLSLKDIRNSILDLLFSHHKSKNRDSQMTLPQNSHCVLPIQVEPIVSICFDKMQMAVKMPT